MNQSQKIGQRQLRLLAFACLILFPTLLYHYPSQILGSVIHQSVLSPDSFSSQNTTEAEMLDNFVEFLRQQDPEDLKQWDIKGKLISPYTSSDLDALIHAEISHKLRYKDSLQGNERLCNQKSILTKKS